MAEKKPSYWEMLRDPRWQKKRLEVMERDKWKCRYCGTKETTLNVHHTFYERGKAPWEYPNDSLMTLCEPCHERRTAEKLELDKMVGGLDRHSFAAVQAFVVGLSAMMRDYDRLPEAVALRPWHRDDWRTTVMVSGLVAAGLILSADVRPDEDPAVIRGQVFGGPDPVEEAGIESFVESANRRWPSGGN